MKRLLLGLLFVACAIYLIPFPADCAGPSAQPYTSPYYMTLKPGIYSPQSGDLEHFDTGFSGEVAFGYRYNPNFAVEMGVGYFGTENTQRISGTTSGFLFSGSEKDTIDVVPITLTFKGIVPVDNWEFFGLGGIGAYIVSGEAKASVSVAGPGTAFSVDGRASDTETVFGAYAGLGFHYNINRTWFVGAEGKYLWTSSADLKDTVQGIPVSGSFKLNGILANAVVGFRF
jgi:outer membrane protein W